MATDLGSPNVATDRTIAMSAFVKNTFLNIVDASGDTPQLHRSASDSDVSKSSGGGPTEQAYFLPSLWSSSHSADSSKINGSRNPENAPWWYRSLAASGATSSQQSPKGVVETFRAKDSKVAPQVPSRPLSMLQGGPPAAARLTEPGMIECEPSPALPPTESTSTSRLDTRHFSQPTPRVLPPSSASTLARPPGLVAARTDPDEMLHQVWSDSSVTSGTEESGADSSMLVQRAEMRVGELPSAESSMLVQRINTEMKGRIPLAKLEEMVDGGVLAGMPRDANGELTSAGSIHHPAGTCTPCAYWFKGICKYSICCNYCHFAHNGQKSKRLRPSKQTRMRIRRWEAQRTPENKSDQPADTLLDGFDDGEDLDDGEEVQRAYQIESL